MPARDEARNFVLKTFAPQKSVSVGLPDLLFEFCGSSKQVQGPPDMKDRQPLGDVPPEEFR